MGKILITGATGQLGNATVQKLVSLIDASQVAVLVRNTADEKSLALAALGVELRQGDYSDFDSLVGAFAGIDKLYFVSGSDIATRTQQHENVVNAAKAAGVKHVIYTSFQRKNETASSPIAAVAEAHILTEKWLAESGMAYTILKHNIYMDMLTMFLGPQILETGILYFPAGYGNVAFTLRSDMANVAAAILSSEGHENKTYDITNDSVVNFHEIAAELAAVTGKPIQYVSPTTEEYIQALISGGVPEMYAHIFAGFAAAFGQGEFDQVGSDIFKLTGEKPHSVAQFLKEVYSA